MKYTLVLDNGQTLSFCIRAAAEIYQRILGGKIVEKDEIFD